MKEAKDVIPWKLTDISIKPYDGFWSMNPSIHYDGETWRCVLRCCDYAMPDGTTIRSGRARVAGQMSKNAMVIFDPSSWKATKIHKMLEKDDLPRVACPNYGYEDMRIFWTDKGGLQGIAASLHLKREGKHVGIDTGGLSPTHQPPEQVILSFDAEYHIVGARPIRGEKWSGSPQKNWVPFDGCAEPRFLYSIDKGAMFDERGAIHGPEAAARPSSRAESLPPIVAATDSLEQVPEQPAQPDEMTPEELPPETMQHQAAEEPRKSDRRHKDRSRKHPTIRGGDVRIVRGGRVSIDALSSRPSSRPPSRSSSRSSRSSGSHRTDDSTKLMGTGRILLPKYEGLRGGSQLVRVGDDAWLGIGHQMKFVSGKKYYWHVWYVVNSRGKMQLASEPMKLVSAGIEFAAGIAVDRDRDRLVVSFGVDDMECWIGETSLSAVMEKLRPVSRE